MSHTERLLGALYVSEGWQVLWESRKLLGPGLRPIYYRTRALVTYDRVMTDRIEPSLYENIEVRHD